MGVVDSEGPRPHQATQALQLQIMVGSWSVCPVCGAGASPPPPPPAPPAPPAANRDKNSRHQRLRRTADVSARRLRHHQSDFNSLPSQSSESNFSQKDLFERLYGQSHHLFPTGLSSQGSSQSNIYEDIEESLTRLGSERDSLYLSISEGRRNHLRSHRFVDWDYGTTEKLQIRRRLQIRKSLTRTCSSILETLKSIF